MLRYHSVKLRFLFRKRISLSSFTTARYILMCVCIFFMLVYTIKVKSELNLYRAKERTEAVGLKTILYWNNYFIYDNFAFGSGRQPFINAKCPINTCFATNDTSLFPVETFDAILFHAYDIPLKFLGLSLPFMHKFPARRSDFQRYVFFLMEPPGNVHSSLEELGGFFNWTMTYRWSSDMPRPYGWITSIDDASKGVIRRERNWRAVETSKYSLRSKNKTKLVAWFVSNCDSYSEREKYAQDLSQYIPVDVYGKCGPLNCVSSCHTKLEQEYKFYLSFENSLCDDYITEKLFDVLDREVVPIVYGGANYSAFIPPQSYINVQDFASPKDLAMYLLYLDKNDFEYNQYFWWKTYYTVHNKRGNAMCKLCEMLHDNLPSKAYHNIRDWWYGHCHLPDGQKWI